MVRRRECTIGQAGRYRSLSGGVRCAQRLSRIRVDITLTLCYSIDRLRFSKASVLFNSWRGVGTEAFPQRERCLQFQRLSESLYALSLIMIGVMRSI